MPSYLASTHMRHSWTNFLAECALTNTDSIRPSRLDLRPNDLNIFVLSCSSSKMRLVNRRQRREQRRLTLDWNYSLELLEDQTREPLNNTGSTFVTSVNKRRKKNIPRLISSCSFLFHTSINTTTAAAWGLKLFQVNGHLPAACRSQTLKTDMISIEYIPFGIKGRQTLK